MDSKTLRHYLTFDDNTCRFVWLNPLGTRMKRGDLAGCVNRGTGYRLIRINSRMYLEHRLVWLWFTGEYPSKHIDHINMNVSDNRFENLRLASVSENARNTTKRKRNRCGFKGVDFDKRKGLYRARIRVNNVQTHLGYFKTPEEAAKAYDDNVVAFHGEFANGNSVGGV